MTPSHTSKDSMSDWRTVGASGRTYEVSDMGEVRFSQCRTLLKVYFRREGYPQVSIKFADGSRKPVAVHRLVADAFLDRTEGATQVNHINGVKTDASMRNLEWVTPAENVHHSINTLGYLVKPVIATCIKTGEEKRFHSTEAAAREIAGNVGNIYRCLYGMRSKHKDMAWRFENPAHATREKKIVPNAQFPAFVNEARA